MTGSMRGPAQARVTISSRCRDPSCRGRLRMSITRPGTDSTQCPRCGAPFQIDADAELAETGRVRGCTVCEGGEFFIRKDFPQRLGLLLVIVFAVVASVFYFQERIVATFATLAALVVIDAVIYLFVARVTVCYRCRAEYRGVAYNPGHASFDLATSEKYDSASRG